MGPGLWGRQALAGFYPLLKGEEFAFVDEIQHFLELFSGRWKPLSHETGL
jgi:hypothetical protein